MAKIIAKGNSVLNTENVLTNTDIELKKHCRSDLPLGLLLWSLFLKINSALINRSINHRCMTDSVQKLKHLTLRYQTNKETQNEFLFSLKSNSTYCEKLIIFKENLLSHKLETNFQLLIRDSMQIRMFLKTYCFIRFELCDFRCDENIFVVP